MQRVLGNNVQDVGDQLGTAVLVHTHLFNIGIERDPRLIDIHHSWLWLCSSELNLDIVHGRRPAHPLFCASLSTAM